MDNDKGSNPIDPALEPTSYVIEPIPIADAPTKATTAYPSRSRKWLVGAALMAAGALAGGGATYAVAGTGTQMQTQVSQRQGDPGGGMGRGGFGARGLPPQDGKQTQSIPTQSGQTQSGTADGGTI